MIKRIKRFIWPRWYRCRDKAMVWLDVVKRERALVEAKRRPDGSYVRILDNSRGGFLEVSSDPQKAYVKDLSYDDAVEVLTNWLYGDKYRGLILTMSKEEE